MAGFVLADLAIGISTLAVSLKDLNQYKGAQTQVQIAVGGGGDYLDGSVPHVSVFDEGGNRIGIYGGDENGHIDRSTVKNIIIDNKFTGGKERQAEYVTMWMNENDAICVSMISVAGNGAQWTWLGDMGKTCGAQWYPSDFKLGDGTYTPPCIWFDADHSGDPKIIARGISLHMPDFNGAEGRANEYRENKETLCNSMERMQLWPNLDMDAIPPSFKPPLKYNTDGSDKKEDLKRIVNRKGGLYPPTKDKRASKRAQAPAPKNRNIDASHLVISDSKYHSAKEVCEHPNAVGWDFVSTVEKVYCDISSGFWWPLCDDKVKDGCFDLTKKELVGNAPGHKGLQARDVGVGGPEPTKKTYKTTKKFGN